MHGPHKCILRTVREVIFCVTVLAVYVCLGVDLAVMVSRVDEENDQVMALSSANFSNASLLMETQVLCPLRGFSLKIRLQTVLNVSGRSWSVKDACKHGASSVSALTSALYPRILPAAQRAPLTVRQNLDAQRELLLLSEQGVHLLERVRPADTLVKMLRERSVPSQQVANFFQLHGVRQKSAREGSWLGFRRMKPLRCAWWWAVPPVLPRRRWPRRRFGRILPTEEMRRW